MLVVIAYDIPESRRRNRIFKILKDYGQWVQYSIFECKLEEKLLIELRDKLNEEIAEDEDSIKFYYLCASCQNKIENLGQSVSQRSEVIII